MKKKKANPPTTPIKYFIERLLILNLELLIIRVPRILEQA